MTPAIDSLRRQLVQLRDQHEQARVDAEAYAQAREPLERALLDHVMAQPALRPSRALWAGFALAVFGLGLAGYSFTGSPSRGGGAAGPGAAALPPPLETRPAVAAVEDKPSADDPRVAEIVDRMAQRLKENPDNPAGWALLGRAHAAMGRPALAVPAFQRAVALTGGDADLLADYADVLAGRDNGQVGPEAISLIERALVLDPGNLKAMALAGSVAFDRRDYAGAVARWDEVARRLPADSAMLPQMRASLARARELGGLPTAMPRPRNSDVDIDRPAR